MKLLVIAAFSVAVGLGQGRDCDTLEKCQVLLDGQPKSSLASFRVGEIFFVDGRYQNALNALRKALGGDHDPGWVEVWAHLTMGKIFDLTGQRVRALNEYRMAVRTNDNTRGALDEATKYMDVAYRLIAPRR